MADTLVDKDLLVTYLSQSSSLRAEEEEDRVIWWGSVLRKADRAHNSHSSHCSHISSSSCRSGNSYISMNSHYVLRVIPIRYVSSHKWCVQTPGIC